MFFRHWWWMKNDISPSNGWFQIFCYPSRGMYMVFPLDVWVYGFCNHQTQNHHLGGQKAISTFSKKAIKWSKWSLFGHIYFWDRIPGTLPLKKIWTKYKVGCVFPMVVSILSHPEFGQNDHREYAPHFIFRLSSANFQKFTEFT